MANVTFKKSLVLLVLTLVFSLSSFAQKKGRVKEFTQEFPAFLVELEGFMNATDNSDLKSVFKQFKKKSAVLAISEKEITNQEYIDFLNAAYADGWITVSAQQTSDPCGTYTENMVIGAGNAPHAGEVFLQLGERNEFNNKINNCTRPLFYS